MLFLWVIVGLGWSSSLFVVQAAWAEDRFHYSNYTDWINHIYGPADWNLVLCDDVSNCPGWPTDWEDFNSFIPYDGSANMCKDCSSRIDGVCEDHRQSPIPLNRNATATKMCNDRHLMRFGEGMCKLEDMDFQILPHVLRAYMPDTCPGEWPWVDFSMGFPYPWLLKFTDVSVPSNHVQVLGNVTKRYDAEVVLSHVYSKNNTKKLIGNLAIFLERGRDSDEYDFLELYIREWRATAKRIKEACGLHRRVRRRFTNITNSTFDDDDLWLPNVDDATRLDDDDSIVYDDNADNDDKNRGVMVQRPYFKRYFQPYDWYVNAKTWYYFRYVGSTPEPPCFESVHWRVLKDPIKVSPRQLMALERLIAKRIDPVTCEKYTAGKQRFPNRDTWRVGVNRPLQTVSERHNLVYCECVDFVSRAENDLEYCLLNMTERGVLNFTNQSTF